MTDTELIEYSPAPPAVVIIKQPEMRDADLCFRIRDEILGVVKSEGLSNLVIDLREITFLGSLAMLVFIAIRRELPEGRIILSELNPQILEAFQVCRLLPAEPDAEAPFEYVASIDDATRALG